MNSGPDSTQSAEEPNFGPSVLMNSGPPTGQRRCFVPRRVKSDKLLVDAEMTKLGGLGPAPPRMAEPIVPGELQKTVTFAFAGPLDDGVRKLAESVGYTVSITPAAAPPPGQAAALPLTVSVSTGFVTAVRAFNAIGNAAGTRALVRVDPMRHLVEVIHYA